MYNWCCNEAAGTASCPLPQSMPEPISLLPPELLAEIFLFCLPEERFPAPSKSSAPLLLAHVCSKWRHIALSMPGLWSGIHLSYRSSVDDVPPAQVWLSRSGDRPLSLSLSIDFDQRPHQAILNLLCRHARRWKHIQFEFRNLSCPPMYDLDLALNNVPMLSTFEFHARDISTFNVLPITRLLSSAPQLKELTWVDDLADTGTLLSLPLSRLARLSLSMNYGRLDYIELLDQCANLEHIRITRPGPDIRSSRTPLLLPKLISLNIAHDLTDLLDHLILPSLKHVRVHSDAADSGHGDAQSSRIGMSILGLPAWTASSRIEGGKNWDPKCLIRLVERSSCDIESLWINTPIKDDDLLTCLKVCDLSLRSLTIRGGLSFSTCSALVRALTLQTPSPNTSDCLCPRLTDLIIDTRVPNACSLVEMVQSRVGHLPLAPQIMPLKRLRFQYPVGHKDISALHNLAIATNSQRRDSLDLTIIESRLGNLRGSSAGQRRPYMFRRKVCASR